MSNEIGFITGRSPRRSVPLGRFLPPIPDGIAYNWLHDNLSPSAWVLDPFGVSPRLSVEAARVGYRVLVAANNPVARFLLEMHAQPPTKNEFRAALADLAVSPKGSERLEPHIRSLYITECAQCTRPVEARFFTWERDNPFPSGRIYQCSHCKDSGERPATPADGERATRFSASGLHRARALERVTPLDDPDRAYAEDALSMYLPRTVYALFTLINKLDSFPEHRRRLLEALLLLTFDQTNVLWPYPSGRGRPRQLNVPPRFMEKNVWIALEEAIEAWIGDSDLGKPGDYHQIPLTTWPDLPPPSGGICIFEGPLRDLVDQAQKLAGIEFQPCGILTALPRPNQAYWTLCSLWAGWLWGHQASASFKSVLRRRRYDWSWHIVALHATFYHLVRMLKSHTPCLGLIGEVEPGFLSAAILAAAMNPMELMGIALRAGSNQAQIHWQCSPPVNKTAEDQASQEKPEIDQVEMQKVSQRAALDYLCLRGEPASYLQLHAAAIIALVNDQSRTISAIDNPTRLIHITDEILQSTFSYRGSFSRYGGSSRSLEVGHWWLDRITEKGSSSNITTSLADRVEKEVIQYLQNNPGCIIEEIDQAMCNRFTGLLTPDLELVVECVSSYGEQELSPSNRWHLRPQDIPLSRKNDVETIQNLICKIGERLRFLVERDKKPDRFLPDDIEPILWKESDGTITYTFYVLDSARLSQPVFSKIMYLDVSAAEEPKIPPRNILVIPGGRSRLVEYKLHHDPRLRSIAEADWRLVKFRHVRSLVENETLNRKNLDDFLNRDPPATRDPQLPLL